MKPKAKRKGNPQNLIVRTGEEARELGRKGGIASGVARKTKHAFADALRNALHTPIPLTSDKEQYWARLLERFGLCDMTAQNLIICRLLDSAIKGDIKASVFIRDTLLMSTGGIEAAGNIHDAEPATLEGRVRHELYRHVKDPEEERAYREVIETEDRKELNYIASIRLNLADSIKADCRRGMLFSGGDSALADTEDDYAQRNDIEAPESETEDCHQAN